MPWVNYFYKIKNAWLNILANFCKTWPALSLGVRGGRPPLPADEDGPAQPKYAESSIKFLSRFYQDLIHV
jgi:hypothetical protein